MTNRFRQGFCVYDVTAGWKHPATQLGLKIIQIGITTEDRHTGINTAAVGYYLVFVIGVGFVNRRNSGSLIKLNTIMLSSFSLSQAKIHGMQMTTAFIHQATNVLLNANNVSKLG